MRDVYAKITNKIIADLKQGVRTWTKPWSADNTTGRIERPLRSNGIPYQGINILMLWAESLDKGYANSTWMTYNQARQLGGQVQKGEHGSLVVYANKIVKQATDRNGNDVDKVIPFMKSYTVFNCEQIEKLPEQYYNKPVKKFNPPQRIENAELFFRNTGADIRNGGNQAFYQITNDLIQMPPFEAFIDPEAYYATLAHESTHWTRHEKRLDRSFGRVRWGDEGYATEELVAELGAAFLAADLELYLEPREDHSAYIGHWLEVLKKDKRAIFTCAGHAQKAVDYLHGLQHHKEMEYEQAS